MSQLGFLWGWLLCVRNEGVIRFQTKQGLGSEEEACFRSMQAVCSSLFPIYRTKCAVCTQPWALLGTAVSELCQEEGAQHRNIKESSLWRWTLGLQLHLLYSLSAFEAECCRKTDERRKHNTTHQGQPGSSRWPWHFYASWTEGRFPSLPASIMIVRFWQKEKTRKSCLTIVVPFFFPQV